VTSCGTSILVNANRELNNDIAKRQIQQNIQSLLTKYANSKEEDIEKQDLKELKRFLNQTRELLSNWSKSKDLKKLRQLSAELNGLTRLTYNPEKKRDQVFLIATDTFLGKQTVEILSTCLDDLGWITTTTNFNDLNTNDTETFLAGVADLAVTLSKLIEDAKQNNNNEIIFNLSGGFKALQGVMQMLATFYADKTIYIFESSDELLEIPTLPIKLDDKIVEKKLREFRRMGSKLKVTLDQVSDIPSYLLFKDQDINDCTLSAWGEVFWTKAKDGLYKEQIYDPPSKLIRYSETFSDDCKKLQPDRRKILNERLDDLAVYLESNREINPNRLDVKPIKGNEKAPSTHEFDAWSDQDAKRVFFHYEGKVAVLDALEKGLGH
jgi:putative CRISPR-associated protein (TIGR02619 family)